jgi:tetratricopeptide (TPR) repeat protein
MHYLLTINMQKNARNKGGSCFKKHSALDPSPGFAREVEVKKIILVTIGVLLMAACAVNSYHSDFAFANKLAKEGLWQEAIFRWQKTATPGGGSAALHNNLAVAMEGLGRYDDARREYELALKLAPADKQIQSNFTRFKGNQRKDANEK